MRIDLNPVGNYTPLNSRNVNIQTRSSEVTPKISEQQTVQANRGILTSEEKTFFTNLYPANKSEIIDYHFYEKNGKLSGVKIGSLIDRRG
ncbi:MAG: hypothetical protein WCA84_20445 [Ignavibacteriaceae bacterium]|jgi:hypothetical protein